MEKGQFKYHGSQMAKSVRALESRMALMLYQVSQEQQQELEGMLNELGIEVQEDEE